MLGKATENVLCPFAQQQPLKLHRLMTALDPHRPDDPRPQHEIATRRPGARYARLNDCFLGAQLVRRVLGKGRSGLLTSGVRELGIVEITVKVLEVA